MHVCAMASARATIGGPLRSDRLKRTSARAAAFQSLTTVAQADVAHTSAATKVDPPMTNARSHTNRWGIGNARFETVGELGIYGHSSPSLGQNVPSNGQTSSL